MFAVVCALILGILPRLATAAQLVELIRTPDGGIQPQAAVDRGGTIHLVYLKGDPGTADIYYTRRRPGGGQWSRPLRVNHRPGSAVAAGTIRGAQLAIGKAGRVHVVWFGSERSLPGRNSSRGAPLLYSRLDDRRAAFEPERDVMGNTATLDGGPSVAADGAGRVYVVWHANTASGEDETGRRLWVARSTDEGRSFAPPAPAWSEPTGACACCSVRAFVDRRGALYVLYRAAGQKVNRDTFLLTSRDHGASFQGTRLHPWKVAACPMSSYSLAEGSAGVLAAWETRGQIYLSRLGSSHGKPPPPAPAPGQGPNRKHPSLAIGRGGTSLLVWTEGTGWEKGGDLVWRGFNSNGGPTDLQGRLKGAVPTWGLPTVVSRPGGGFSIIY